MTASDGGLGGTMDESAAAPAGLNGLATVVRTLLDACPEPAVVLDAPRQIVLANDKLAALAGVADGSFVGQRLGDLLGCAHAHIAEGGCGTTPFCVVCGANTALLDCAASGRQVVKDYRVTRDANAATVSLDLRVWTTPFAVGARRFTIVALRDMTDTNRRAVLERVFFHDLLNAAGALRGLMQLWPFLTPEESAEVSRSATRLAGQIVGEIEAQRDLAAAERGEFESREDEVDVGPFLEDVCTLYAHHSVAQGRRVAPPRCPSGASVRTDRVLLTRVIGNLLKNALEASPAGGEVAAAFEADPAPVFVVHNDGAMDEAVRLQIFQRAFTTRAGRGRGLGTYSVKLLVERYLGGAVSFTSAPDAGTTFTVRLPVRP